MTLARTFELYVCDDAGQRTFEALTCQRADLIRRAREVLEQKAAAAVEIWEAGEHLLTLAA
ncbi:MAG: hypothetical protein GC203_21850 [Phenylobacterium sp.]|uniref:hypothetical protein n=1 Tax=Phenylobacterium sp. TaxID=1871053 RepID=UPI002600991F|nr:hypothetical protein [Phenylobacterium sp.]MBI1200513.1 hypothetical protein [Phenylobacterium sp.]